MLFAQIITLRYCKDVRYPVFAAQRRAVRFWALPQEIPPENEILLHMVYLQQDPEQIACIHSMVKAYGADAFFDGGYHPGPFPARLAVTKSDGAYHIGYCGKEHDGIYSNKMHLQMGEYGRIIYNQRGAYQYTGIWYYDLTICNFVHASYAECRQKLFYRKEPDVLFEDLRRLRYC